MNSIISIAENNIDNDWKEIVIELLKKYNEKIDETLNKFSSDDIKIFPPINQIFNAFKLCSINDIKVVLISQDPYHGLNQANGLAFSINNGNKVQPSLRRIFKSLKNIYGIERTITDLSDIAEQGVLLLNRALTVQENKPNSHYNIWYEFTMDVIKYINENCNNIVFLLYGNSAKELIEFINKEKHCILTDYHPSPLSRHDFNGKFKECDDYLINIGKTPIKWV